MNSQYLEAYIDLGNCWAEEGDLNEAVLNYMEVVRLNPEYVEAYFNLGIVFKKQGKINEAIKCYKRAIECKPDFAQAGNNLGNIYFSRGQFKEATAVYTQVLSFNPNHAETYYNLGILYKKIGELEKAIEFLKLAIENNPNHEEAKFILYSLNGSEVNSAPSIYVEKLFDEYAESFEKALVNELSYDAPEKLFKLLKQYLPIKRIRNVLDFGCGTGLMGAYLREYCRNLVGIDISQKMLEIAARKNIYDRLEKIDIGEYLSASDLHYDLISATDVFIYVGDLDEIFLKIKENTKQPVWFVFCTEHNEASTFKLEKSGRFSHPKRYIDSLCNKYGYSVIHFSLNKIRTEGGIWLDGGYYILRFDPMLC